MISSFIIVGWITVFVAFIPAYHSFADWWYRFEIVRIRRQWVVHSSSPLASGKSTSTALETSKILLNSLCDLQVLTGTAIVISAAAQLPDISFYHEQIAINLWWFTLNSFWAARIEQFYNETELFSARLTLRRISILISVILGTAFQVKIDRREEKEWDIYNEGHCYLFKDDTSTWPWVAGAILYGLSLLLNIIPFGRPLLKRYETGVDRGQKVLIAWWFSAFHSVDSRLPPFNRKSTRLWPLLDFRLFQKGLSTLSVLLYFLLRETLALWSYGDGFYPLDMIAYIGFAIWNTFDILSLKVLNKQLIVGEQNKFGFGQVFPLVMMAASGFVAFDAVIGTLSFPL